MDVAPDNKTRSTASSVVIKQLEEKNYFQASLIMKEESKRRFYERFIEDNDLKELYEEWREEILSSA